MHGFAALVWKHLDLTVIHESQAKLSRLREELLDAFPEPDSGARPLLHRYREFYDDPRFELGRTPEESFRRVSVAHKNCYDYCLKGKGATCRTRPL